IGHHFRLRLDICPTSLVVPFRRVLASSRPRSPIPDCVLSAGLTVSRRPACAGIFAWAPARRTPLAWRLAAGDCVDGWLGCDLLLVQPPRRTYVVVNDDTDAGDPRCGSWGGDPRRPVSVVFPLSRPGRRVRSRGRSEICPAGRGQPPGP